MWKHSWIFIMQFGFVWFGMLSVLDVSFIFFCVAFYILIAIAFCLSFCMILWLRAWFILCSFWCFCGLMTCWMCRTLTIKQSTVFIMHRVPSDFQLHERNAALSVDFIVFSIEIIYLFHWTLLNIYLLYEKRCTFWTHFFSIITIYLH